MFVKNFMFILFISFLIYVNCQDSDSTESDTTVSTLSPEEQYRQFIQMYGNVCMPTPQGIDLLSSIQTDCRSLYIPSTNDTQFYCCELDFQEKKNKSASARHGCMAFLKNYIDNDRYEDIIDYIERGKQDKIEEYSVFLGKTLASQFTGFLKNKTKYKVNKLDCFSIYILTNYIFMFVLIFLLFGIF